MSGDAPSPLPIRDYSLTARATGLAARNVRELRERLDAAPDGALFHHFWGRLLRGEGGEAEYGNDLAEWAADRLHDLVLAERLALVDPLHQESLDALRECVAEILDARIEEVEGRAPETTPEDGFHFVADQMVIYETAEALERPDQLEALVDDLPAAALFLHFVDPPGLPRAGEDDPSVPRWLRAFGGRWVEVAGRLEAVDVFLRTPDQVRDALRRALAAGSPDSGRGP